MPDGRKDSHPGKAGRDKRSGTMNFIAGGDASPDELKAFQSDNRWNWG